MTVLDVADAPFPMPKAFDQLYSTNNNDNDDVPPTKRYVMDYDVILLALIN